MHDLHSLLLPALALAGLTLPALSFQGSYELDLLFDVSLTSYDNMGTACDIAGDRAVVGAVNHPQPGGGSGSAFVYEHSGVGGWVPGAELINSDQNFSSLYGSAVAVSGDVAVVGDSGEMSLGFNTGVAYVFERQAIGGWPEVARLTASDISGGADFGIAVDLDGDRLAIGAARAKVTLPGGSTIQPGAVYLFERQVGGGWLEVAKITASDNPNAGKFGESLSLSGDRLLVGCSQDDPMGSSSGSAYVFDRTPSGTWVEVAKLYPADGDSNDYFGYAVGLSGDRAVMGAWLDKDVPGTDGSAYIFERQVDGSWLETAKLLSGSGSSIGDFGQSVAIAGEQVLIGAHRTKNVNPVQTDAGRVYSFFRLSDGTWSQGAEVAGGSSGDQLGRCVALSGGHGLTGIPYEDTAAKNAGAAVVLYYYHPSDPQTPTIGGVGTSGCTGQQLLTAATPPIVGSSSFALTCSNAPSSSVGFLGLNTAPDLVGNDLLGIGVTLHLDLVTDPALLLFPMQSDAMGTGVTPLPLPNLASLVGLTFHAQVVWPWSGVCSLPPLDLSSSTLLSFGLIDG